MPLEIVMFPEEVIELNRELANGLHAPLQEIMHGLDSHVSFQERLGHIAAYCELVLDGQYMPDDIAGICGELVKRLKDKRVLPASQTIIQIH